MSGSRLPRRVLVAPVTFHVSFEFNELNLDPRNTLELAIEREKFLKQAVVYLGEQWDGIVPRLREQIRLVKPPSFVGEMELAADDESKAEKLEH